MKKLLESPVLSFIILAYPGICFAQAAGADPATKAAPVSKTDTGIADIIVTAERREGRLQRVPIMVSVLSGDVAGQRGIANTSDLNTAIPNLEMSQQQNGITPFIRGVGSSLVAQGNEPSVATYVDGVYMPSAVGAWFDFNNIQRIEVLAGPQGTLFGRNATGGVIQVVTKDPSHQLGGQFVAGYSNYNTVTSTGYLTGGITDTVAADISYAFRNQGDGWGKSSANGGDVYFRDEFSLRGKVRYASGNLVVVATADFNRTKSDLGIAASFLPGAVGDDGVTKGSGFYNTSTQPNNIYTIDQGGGSLKIDYDVDWARIVSISSYRRIVGHTLFDSDATPATIIEPDIKQKESTWTQEIQLISANKSPVQWVLGAYFFNDAASYDPLRLQGSGLGGLPYLDIFGDSKTVSYSGYGQATFPIVDKVHLTAGGRYTTDKRSVVGIQDFGGTFQGYADPDTGALVPGTFSASKRFSKVTYKGGLDYQVMPDIMLYASASRGFKSGSFNVIRFTDPPVRPEVLDAYETGIKSSFFDKKLLINLSGYIYDYKDIQLVRSIHGAIITFNATSAKIRGLDLQVIAAPTPRLTFNAGLSYVHGRYGAFPGAPISTPNPAGGNTVVTGDASGNVTIHTPVWKGDFTAAYSIPVAIGRIDLSASYAYNDGFFWDPDNRNRQKAYSIFNASVGITTADEKYRITFWGKNLNNARYYTYVTSGQDGDIGAPAPPRTYGASVSAKF